ncbi:hypothetical protein [Bacillus stratosphericus]|uniref:hypothetical protein n=1 Tax=Bacillus stratosphericus TaxID=293386 RepID=UPI001CFC2B54|nr:hypothetical protein [Bacillus stratosphericus]
MAATTIQKLKEQLAQHEEKLKKARAKLQKDIGKKFLDTFNVWEKDPKEINKLIVDLHAKYEINNETSEGESDDNRIGNSPAQ